MFPPQLRRQHRCAGSIQHPARTSNTRETHDHGHDGKAWDHVNETFFDDRQNDGHASDDGDLTPDEDWDVDIKVAKNNLENARQEGASVVC